MSGVLNLQKWIAENKELLKPPVNNYCLHHNGLIIMLVGGPNHRLDYHVNETPEWFYQLKGKMVLKIKDPKDGQFKDIEINEGDTYMLAGLTPHCPTRFADTIGLVVEMERPEGTVDRLRWYCPKCRTLVHEAAFPLTNLGTQVKDAIESFEADTKLHQCPKCPYNFGQDILKN